MPTSGHAHSGFFKSSLTLQNSSQPVSMSVCFSLVGSLPRHLAPFCVVRPVHDVERREAEREQRARPLVDLDRQDAVRHLAGGGHPVVVGLVVAALVVLMGVMVVVMVLLLLLPPSQAVVE